ncbi:MAG: DUF1080 domain-containing protein [bacterium]|nr:DUF1080 domain-containing protein [bacterium]
MRWIATAAIFVLALALVAPASAQHVVFLVGEQEYGSHETMPRFAERLERELGLRTTVLQSEDKRLPDLAALDDADLLVLYLRFREASPTQFERLREWFDAGKPAVALRTTSHAFLANKGWFPPFFGGHYKAHAPNGQGTVSHVLPSSAAHPILRGIASGVAMGHGGTYNAQPLADTVTPLLLGRTGDLPCEPIAWVNRYRAESRIFYTSLGSRENFEQPDFQRLLGNAVLWCLRQPVEETGVFGGKKVRPTFTAPPVPSPPRLAAPATATVLFDGESTAAWRHWDPSVAPRAIGIDRRADSSSGGPKYDAARWGVEDGALVARPGFGDILSRDAFGDYHLHVDFFVPVEPSWVAPDARGNSGIYLGGRYELQILGSDTATPDDHGLGAIFDQREPRVAAGLAPGEWQHLDVHFRHRQDRDPTLSAWLNGKPIHERVRLRERTVYGFRDEPAGARSSPRSSGVRYSRPADESFEFGTGEFTIAARFRTRRGGTITSKSPRSGRWQPNGKSLFLRNGRLVYDIGWVGAMQSPRRFDDGRWHRVILTHEGETAYMFVDGELVAEREDFVAEDDPAHVFKIGATAPDFGGRYTGEISDVLVFEHDIPADKARQWTRNEVVDLGTPALDWQPPKRPIKQGPPPEPPLVKSPIRLQSDSSAVRFANIWVDALPPTPAGPPIDESRDWPTYRRMDHGNALHWTYEVGDDNIAQKAIAIRLDDGTGGISRGNAFVAYDHDTMRIAAAWSGPGFIDWRGVAFDGSHNSHARIAGDVAFTNPPGPGWANPATGKFDDPRPHGRDSRPYGPLPRSWLRYRGRHQHGTRSILEYTVGQTRVLDMPDLAPDPAGVVFRRTLSIGPRTRGLTMRVAPVDVRVELHTDSSTTKLERTDGFHVLHMPAGANPVQCAIAMTSNAAVGNGFGPGEVIDLETLLGGGQPRWSQTLETKMVVGAADGPFAVDTLTLPDTGANPWHSWLRLGGIDFFADGNRAAVCTWNGDVWTVEGLVDPEGALRWRRIAAGLYQPLGLCIVDGRIHLGCRDQICVLEDRNGDGETDFYRCFNNDHQVTEHFHEFAMGLQRDQAGNFYYAKSARHAKPALVPHHGTLLQVAADGSRTDILANGFRAANGVCINQDGSFYVTDQEGHWTPKNRINRVVRGGFYGNMMGYHDRTSTADADMAQPLCWITNAFDRSPAELLRVPDSRWGLPQGSLLQLSYGMGRIFLVLEDRVGDVHQGGMVALPIEPFPTGIMRGRFHPATGDLYCCGLYGWSGARTRPGGLYRVRHVGGDVTMPIAMRAVPGGLELVFGTNLDPETANDTDSYGIKAWRLQRSKRYGSKHLDERMIAVTAAKLADDGRTVRLTTPDLQPTMGLEIRCNIETPDEKVLRSVIHGTLHAVK